MRPQELQRHVDRLVLVAAELETRLRGGEDGRMTRETYWELRKVRLDIIALAVQKKVALPAIDAVRFEERLDELDRYFSEP